MNGWCNFLEVWKDIEEIKESKIHWSQKLSLWIRKCVNQQLVRARSVSMLTLKILYLWPPVPELCGPFNLIRASVFVLALWRELVPLKAWVLAAAQRGGRCCCLVLSMDVGPRASGPGGQVVNMLGISPCGCWALSGIQLECKWKVLTVPCVSVGLRSIRCKIFKSWSISWK